MNTHYDMFGYTTMVIKLVHRVFNSFVIVRCKMRGKIFFVIPLSIIKMYPRTRERLDAKCEL